MPRNEQLNTGMEERGEEGPEPKRAKLEDIDDSSDGNYY